ncbi:MAG: glycosyltransferase [Endozoicomonas sp.]|uniref:glycosyltransferase n=1 Tax=Endozoicomonas sp. TaxID=1892382 RepID=UPI003D9AF756
MSNLSVIVPLGPNEPEWPTLFDQLNLLPEGSEIILVGYQDKQQPTRLEQLPEPLQKLNWIWCTAERGRASQLNTGARKASADHVWFLHADSILSTENVQGLLNAIH